MTSTRTQFDSIINEFERNSGLSGVRHSVLQKASGPLLTIYVSHPTERLYKILEKARLNAATDQDNPPLATIKKQSKGDLLDGPEGKLFRKIISESQNVNRFSFEKDFLVRYTKSVSGAESQIIASSNHLVLGRRGAGKSMLLLYAYHHRIRRSLPSVWVDMQVYSGRDDDEAIADVFIEIINQISFEADYDENANFLLSALRSTDINLNQIKRLLPQIKRFLAGFSGAQGDLFILLDDFHVVTKELQPKLLDAIYAVARGNKIYLKISAIEAFVRTFDPETSVGLEVPHDVQIIGLDYNLTAPDKATAHIEAILDAHAQYAGIPSIRRLCSSADVIPRLTWVAAGVPRDALNLFSQAMTKASVEGRQRVTVSNVNVAASENLSSKLRELKADASKSASDLQRFLDRVKDFCVSKKRSNAFLVEIRSDDDLFDKVMKLVNLRFLHVISEGITVGEAGKKYVGLILDYGFYTGIRAAQSVDLFNRQTERPSYKELRRLPVLRPA